MLPDLQSFGSLRHDRHSCPALGFLVLMDGKEISSGKKKAEDILQKCHSNPIYIYIRYVYIYIMCIIYIYIRINIMYIYIIIYELTK